MTPNKWWPLGQTPSDGEPEPAHYATKEEVQEMMTLRLHNTIVMPL